MILGKGYLLILLITTFNVANLQGAPQQTPRQDPVPLSPNRPAAGTPEAPPDKPANAADQPNDSNLVKPVTVKPTSDKPKPAGDVGTGADETLSNCWTCLLEAAADLCSYLMDWTGPNKISTFNLFSLFQGRSSEESVETTENSASSAISNLFRFRRSPGRFRRSVPVQDVSATGIPVQDVPVDGVPVEAEAFLDILHGFYLKMRDRFLRENAETISPSLVDLYKRHDELVDVAAYVLGVPRDRLVEAYERLKSKDTGAVLLQALDDRMAMLSGEQRSVKSIRSLTPTSISYFFKELLASFNGVANGFSELFSIALQNGIPQILPNMIN